MADKDFAAWFTLKQKLDALPVAPFYKEGDIWWCSVGVNIGHEIFGKGETFSRPVLVLKKFSHFTFLGIPMTTGDVKPGALIYAYPLKNNGDNHLRLDQMRTFDARRLGNRMTHMSENDLSKVFQAVKDMV